MVGVHVLDRARLGPDELLGPGEVGHDLLAGKIHGAGEAAVQMRTRDPKAPEREVPETGVEPGFRMAGQKALSNSRLLGDLGAADHGQAGCASGSPLRPRDERIEARLSFFRFWV